MNAIKDALEDAKRHKQDRIVNNRVVQIVKEGHLVDVYWKDLSVGDIVRLENNAFIPADILVLSTSDEKNSRCYIETRFFSLLSSLFSLFSSPLCFFQLSLLFFLSAFLFLKLKATWMESQTISQEKGYLILPCTETLLAYQG